MNKASINTAKNLDSGLISFCCVSYNHEKFIERCLESIWSQDYKNIEIIVVDDGSTDESVKVLENLKSKSPFPLKILTQQNTGNVGKNFNRALSFASGDFVTFISCDDYYYTDMASFQMSLFKEDQELAVVGFSQITGVDELGVINEELVPSLKINSISSPNIENLLDLEFNLEGSFYIQGSIFKRDVVNLVGGFDDDMTGDDLILRTKVFLHIKNNQKHNFKIINRSCCYYRMHGNNIHKNSIRQMKIVSEYLEKYWPRKKLPKIFFDWLKHTIRMNSLDNLAKMFFYNKTLFKSFFKIKILRFLLKKIRRSIKSKIKSEILTLFSGKAYKKNKVIGAPKVLQKTIFLGDGKIVFGDNVQFGFTFSPSFYSNYGYIEARHKESTIMIGDNTVISNNSCIIAHSTKITIGRDCCIGVNFQCFDSNFHGLEVSNRDNAIALKDSEVQIGNNCFIGHNVSILKGVKIGDGSVIGLGSVVTKSFPENSLIAGNPAKLIRKIQQLTKDDCTNN